jgi:hypothetical protein
MALQQAIQGDDRHAAGNQDFGADTTDVTRRAGNENIHLAVLLESNRSSEWIGLILPDAAHLDTEKRGVTARKCDRILSLRQAALKGKKNEVGTTAHAKLVEQVRNVEFYRAFRNVELVGDFLVGKIFQQRIENFLLAAAEIGD